MKDIMNTIGFALLKGVRGLFAENKNGEWEVSQGRVAFWVVFIHCMYVWNTITENIIAGVQTIVRGSVSDGELYTLLALLGYAGVKVGSDMVKTSVNIWKTTTQDQPVDPVK